MPDQAPQTLDEILHKYEIGFVTHGRDVNEHFNSYKQALTSLIEQARLEGYKKGYIDAGIGALKDGDAR